MEYSETIPIQYQEGRASFLGMDVMVDPRVLIPRPETELLVRTVSRLCAEKGWKEPLVLEVGTGSGVIPLGLARLVEGCRVVATDISEGALEVARENLELLGGGAGISLVASDMFAALKAGKLGIFDCVVSNPPYVSDKDYENLDAWVRAEPGIALRAGKEGLDHLEKIAGASAPLIKKGGFLAVEVGYDQAARVKGLFSDNGFEGISSYRDFNGYERVIVGWKHG